MTQVRYVGLDLGMKTTHEVVVAEPGDASPRARFRCGHTAEDLEEMLRRVREGMAEGTELQFLMEPTGTAWQPVAAFVQDKGSTAYLVKAETVQDQRKVLRKHAKTDVIDATALVMLPRVIPESLHPVPPLNQTHETLLRRVKQAHRLSIEIGECKLRVEALVFQALPVGVNSADLFTVAGRVLCHRYLNPYKVRRLGLPRLTLELQGLAGDRNGAETAARWHQACLNAIALFGKNPPFDYVDLQAQCCMEFEQLELVERQAEQVAQRRDTVYRELNPSRNLETIPGVGPYAAAASVAALGSPVRFDNGRKYRAYTGLIPKVSSSGQTESKQIPLSKAGPAWLRRALYLAAEIARHRDPQLAKVYYDQMVTYGHHHTHAVCAVAGHLAERIYAVYRSGRSYQLQDLEGQPISQADALEFIRAHLTVPETVRKQLRRKNKGKHRPRRPEPVKTTAQTRKGFPAPK